MFSFLNLDFTVKHSNLDYFIELKFGFSIINLVYLNNKLRIVSIHYIQYMLLIQIIKVKINISN